MTFDMKRSPIATQTPGVRDPNLGIQRDAWGLLLHTTGGGITDKARRTARRPVDVAIATYIDMQNGSEGYLWGGPAYVIDHDGSIYQVAPDNIMTAHCGGANRRRYFDGSWERDCSSPTVSHWHAKWSPRYAHPYELFPSTSPNHDYVGVEMIPIGDGFGGAPFAPGLVFTKAQHDAAVWIARDVAQRNAFPADWAQTSRLLGHEDVDPLNRSNAGGGWDPGYLRSPAFFDFDFVRRSI